MELILRGVQVSRRSLTQKLISAKRKQDTPYLWINVLMVLMVNVLSDRSGKRRPCRRGMYVVAVLYTGMTYSQKF